MTPPIDARTYCGIPALAGLCSLEEAAQPGLGVEACVTRLKRFHYAFLRLHEILTARITAEPIYELKTGFSYHSYLCAEHVQALRTRVGEMREPPLGLEQVPDQNLQIFFDEIIAAPTTGDLLVGVYQKALPALDAALARYMNDTNPLTDAPSNRVLRFARLEIADMLSFGQQSSATLVAEAARTQMAGWLQLLDDCLNRAGGLDGVSPLSSLERGVGGEGDTRSAGAAAPLPPVPSLLRGGGVEAAPLSPPTSLPQGARGEPGRQYSATPYVYNPVPQRDERWQDLYNQGVNAESFLYMEEMPAKAKTLMMLYKRLREIDVPEMMASIITETKGKPWGYYRGMSRQLWDEARHAMMGQVGFVALGVDWTQARITHNWSLRLNTECTPLERHAVLYFIEQGLMTRTGKRYEWEVGVESGIPLAATIQDFDWADEVLHAQLGREWYIPQVGDWKQALDYGDKCWSRILSNWRTVLEQGLTRHENWWPGIYLQACQHWGETPDPKALAFNETYEGQRADLQSVGASG